MARLFALYPGGQAEKLAALLAEGSTAFIYEIDDSPEAARLLSLIYAIREADQVARMRDLERSKDLRHGVAVTLVLVDRLGDRAADVEIVRRARVSPQNIILVKRSALSARVLLAAIAGLLRSRAEHGPYVREDVRLSVKKEQITRQSPTSDAEQYVDLLRRATVREVVGLGKVAAADIRVRVAH